MENTNLANKKLRLILSGGSQIIGAVCGDVYYDGNFVNGNGDNIQFIDIAQNDKCTTHVAIRYIVTFQEV